MNVKDLLFKSVTPAHQAVLKVTGGKVGGDLGGMPVLEVTTTGAKSGKSRTVMLTSPLKHQGHYVVVASKGGDPKSPSWFHNMVAHPEVEVTYKGTSQKMTARVVTPQERAELWPKVAKAYKGYAGYQEKTTREIPLVVLEG